MPYIQPSIFVLILSILCSVMFPLFGYIYVWLQRSHVCPPNRLSVYLSDTVDMCDFCCVISTFSSLFFLAVSSYSKCSSRTPPLPLSFVMCPERSEKGSLCTCAGEHLNKCIVFCGKSSCLFHIPKIHKY